MQLLSPRRISETVDVTHPILDILTFRPHADKTQLSDGARSSRMIFTIDVNLHHCAFLEPQLAKWPEDTVFIFCFDNHNASESSSNDVRSYRETGQVTILAFNAAPPLVALTHQFSRRDTSRSRGRKVKDPTRALSQY